MLLNNARNILMGILLICMQVNTGAGQQITSRNLQYLDSVEKNIRMYFCENVLNYPAGYEKKKIARDMHAVLFLNMVFSNDIDRKNLLEALNAVKRVRVGKRERGNGLIREDHIIINGNYLRVKLTIESIGTSIFRKLCIMEPTTKALCGPYRQAILDYRLLNVFARKINFPIRVFDYYYVKATDFNIQTIRAASLQYPDYKFNIPDSGSKDGNNNLYNKQYNCDYPRYYSFFKADEDYVALIKSDQIDAIKKLLFSPNYFYAVNAMEALIYLSSANKLELDDTVRAKMNSLKQQEFPITVQKTGDVFQTYDGYKSLDMTDDKVVRKYRNVFQSNESNRSWK